MDIVRQLVESRPDFFQNRIANQDRVVKINDFISMSIGLSNAYMVATPAGRVIINTGMGFEALTHKKVFDAECPGPTPYIVLTQGHVDHVGGVELFREPATEIIAQANNRACQEDDARIHRFRVEHSAPFFPIAVDRAERGLAMQANPTPTITFSDRYDFELGFCAHDGKALSIIDR